MEIQLLTVPECPNRDAARDRVREALERVGASHATVAERVIDDPAAARSVGMHGSPTVLIDGRDPFAPSGTDASVSCRLYRTSSGFEGSPSVDALVEAMSRPEPDVP